MPDTTRTNPNQHQQMATLEITYIGKDHFDRELFLAPKGTLNTLRDIFLVDIAHDYENHGGRDLCTVCIPKDGNPFWGEPDSHLGDRYDITVTNEAERRNRNENPFRFSYMLLDRLRCDCLYHIGSARENGFNSGITDIEDHIARMKELWNSLPEDGKPAWLTMEEIEDLKSKMLSEDIFHPDENGKLKIHTKR